MTDNLKEYEKKRNFKTTKEPTGRSNKNKSKKLRFVVQHHMARRDHYDFRLEWNGVLLSWAVPKGPSYKSKDKRLAIHVEDHPYDYRNFEGTIPKGEYGGGTVMIWDEGYWHPNVDVEEGLDQGNLKFELKGERLKGNWVLIHIKPRDGEKDNNWLLIKEKDDYDGSSNIDDFNTSVKTYRTMDEITEGDSESKDSKMSKSTTEKKNNMTSGKTGKTAKDVEITNPDKILYEQAQITKQDIVDYYEKISGRMLPYIENRILSVVRCPGGVDGSCFFKKHPSGEKGVGIVDVKNSEGDKEEYYYITDEYGLLSEVQMNTLEFHTWASSAQNPEKPDVMVFDLDPDEGMDLKDIRSGVKDLKGLLEDLGLITYLKTSGGKGYHIVVPFKPSASWDTFHDFAKNIAKTMVAKWPKKYTDNVRKDSRKNRIFIDYIRNNKGATSIAPYSVRARQDAAVSMPIRWNELDKVAPNEIKMEDAVKRLRRKDPWDGFFETDQKLSDVD